MIDYDLTNTFHYCPKLISSLLESAPELASSDNTSQHVFWFEFSFLQFNYIKSNVSPIEYPEFSSVVEYAL
jgi:hypothetical protein